MNPGLILVKREFQEDFKASRGAVFLVIAALVLSAFAVLLVSNTELSLLDNAQAVYMMAGIIIALAALVAVIRGSDGFAGERDRQTLEPLLLAPINGPGLAAAKLGGLVFSWLIPSCFLMSNMIDCSKNYQGGSHGKDYQEHPPPFQGRDSGKD